MRWDRRRRLEAQLKEKIALVVLDRLGDPCIGFTTFTRVELSRDKKYARVFYTVLGEPSQMRSTARALKRAAPHIQEILAPTLRMRNVPELRFEYDESVARESSMRDLLADLEAEREEQDDTAEPSPPSDDVSS
jgi:ribosome-binding factor A